MTVAAYVSVYWFVGIATILAIDNHFKPPRRSGFSMAQVIALWPLVVIAVCVVTLWKR